MFSFWSSARMDFWKFPSETIIITYNYIDEELLLQTDDRTAPSSSGPDTDMLLRPPTLYRTRTWLLYV